VFTLLATPATQSILEDVQKLDAGHRMLVNARGDISIDRYWDVRFEADPDAHEADLLDELRHLLEESVRLHLRSDVPLGAFLSGGVDSSAIVSLMSRLNTSRIKTFSIGFDEPSFDERAHARRTAAECGTEHHELVVRPQALDVIEDIVWHLDEPFGDSSAIPTYYVSQLAAQHVKVVLTGDGGDELFGGYDKYVVEERERSVDRLPRWLRRPMGVVGGALPFGTPGRRFLRHFALDGHERYLDACSLFTARDQRSLFSSQHTEAVAAADPYAVSRRALGAQPDASPLSALQYCDLRSYLPLDILVKVDRMTMAHSLEARPPLLDHKIVEFAARVPAQMQIRNSATKYLFKEAVSAFVPSGVLTRPKQGFAIPLGSWFRGPWTSFARDILLSQRSRERGIFNPKYLERLISINEGGRNLDRELWTLVCFEQWCQLFLDSAPAAGISGARSRIARTA
jgi:asparagine synthase (glutamine-hydrolysing)